MSLLYDPEKNDDDKTLKNMLNDSEKVLWKGKPEDFPLLSETDAKSVKLRWFISGAIFVVATIWYFATIIANNLPFNIAFLIIVFLLCGVTALTPITTRRSLLKKFSYYVTDQRVFIIRDAHEIDFMKAAETKKKIVDGEKGCIHLLMGIDTDIKAIKYRDSALVTQKDPNFYTVGLVLYNVKDDGELRKSLQM